MSNSRLKPGGKNKFQAIKAQTEEAIKKGIKVLKMSIGQPSGPAPFWARLATAIAVLSNKESMHEYQDNGSPGCPDFAGRFVRSHPGNNALIGLEELGDISYLPVPGIKSSLWTVINAMGGYEHPEKPVTVVTTSGYPTPAWSANVSKGVIHKELPFLAEQGFLPTKQDLDALELKENDLIMLNLPNNPTGAGASEKFYHMICSYCQEHKIYLFNDAAYSMLRFDYCDPNLAQIAILYPGLQWCEGYSTSKAGNMTGWRVAALVGSKDFMIDIATINGNINSGVFAAAMCGVAYLFERRIKSVFKVRNQYRNDMVTLISAMESAGMRLATKPKGTFFCDFYVPKTAFGQDIKQMVADSEPAIEDAEAFNALMIDKTGIVGVPFGKYIRYAVCTLDIASNIDEIKAGFNKANVQYV